MMIQDKMSLSQKLSQDDSASATSTQQDSSRANPAHEETKQAAVVYYHSDQSVNSDSHEEEEDVCPHTSNLMMLLSPKTTKNSTDKMGLDEAFWNKVRAEREVRDADDKVWRVAHEKSMLYDFEVGVRCKVASKKAARSLIRMGRTIKQSMDTIEQYRHLMDKKPLRTNVKKPAP